MRVGNGRSVHLVQDAESIVGLILLRANPRAPRYVMVEFNQIWDRPMDGAQKHLALLLCDIHEALNIKNRTNTKLIREAITTGNMWALDHSHFIAIDRETDSHVCEEVFAIMDMWFVLETAVHGLSNHDRSKLEAEIAPFTPRFAGFHANNDDHYGIACFAVQFGMFAHFKGRYLNSHSSNLGAERRMLGAYRVERDALTLTTHGLSIDQLVRIFNARTYPDFIGDRETVVHLR